MASAVPSGGPYASVHVRIACEAQAGLELRKPTVSTRSQAPKSLRVHAVLEVIQKSFALVLRSTSDSLKFGFPIFYQSSDTSL